MTITSTRRHLILTFSMLVLAGGIAMHAMVGHVLWLLSVAALLACASALALNRAWRGRLVGTLLLCVGATTMTASAAALVSDSADVTHTSAATRRSVRCWSSPISTHGWPRSSPGWPGS